MTIPAPEQVTRRGAGELPSSSAPIRIEMMSEKPWWYSQSGEYLNGPFATRADAVDAGIEDYCGEPFHVCQGARFKYAAPTFDAGDIAERFDDVNAEYGPEDDYPASGWTNEAMTELEAELAGVLNAWLDRHAYRDAWAIDVDPHEHVDASAIEVRRAETEGLGAQHESAIGDSRDALTVAAQ